MDLGPVDTKELFDRLEMLMRRLDESMKEIAPKLSAIGNMREEAAVICSELEKRGCGGK